MQFKKATKFAKQRIIKKKNKKVLDKYFLICYYIYIEMNEGLENGIGRQNYRKS